MPLVTVVCTCYNQEAFIIEALESVFNQTYPKIELIVIDDCSSDNSVRLIEKKLQNHPEVKFISNNERVGLCANFNKGWRLSGGDYLIDLSGDDVLLPSRIADQIQFFQGLTEEYGVIYSNAEVVDTTGKLIGYSYPVNDGGQVKNQPPQGDIYETLIERYVVATQTMMMRRTVLDDLDGYDEQLAYEDFDFWVRSSRHRKYAFQDKVLTRIRKRDDSLSSQQYKPNDDQLKSTYLVCKKIRELNRNQAEDRALVRRLKYEVRHAVLANKHEEAQLFLELLSEMQPLAVDDKFFQTLSGLKVDTAWLRNAYLKLITPR